MHLKSPFTFVKSEKFGASVSLPLFTTATPWNCVREGGNKKVTSIHHPRYQRLHWEHPPETGIGCMGTKKVTSKRDHRYQRLDGEAGISYRLQQLSVTSRVPVQRPDTITWFTCAIFSSLRELHHAYKYRTHWSQAAHIVWRREGEDGVNGVSSILAQTIAELPSVGVTTWGDTGWLQPRLVQLCYNIYSQ